MASTIVESLPGCYCSRNVVTTKADIVASVSSTSLPLQLYASRGSVLRGKACTQEMQREHDNKRIQCSAHLFNVGSGSWSRTVSLSRGTRSDIIESDIVVVLDGVDAQPHPGPRPWEPEAGPRSVLKLLALV